VIILPLNERHDRASFDCGVPGLTKYVQRYAGQHDRKGFGRTFVALEEGSSQIQGYYTISSGSVSFHEVPENVPHHPVPVVLIGRLAVDLKARGKGLGEILLMDALRRSKGVADQLGIYAVAVHAIDEQARAFYSKYGFRALLDEKLHLYLPMKVIRKLNL
jgi:GNAT superfamily N-acetyltransferase